MSVKKYTSGVHNVTASSSASQQQIQDSSRETGSLDELRIVSLNPKYSDEEQKSISRIFENQIDNLFASSCFEKARALINTMIESFPGIWRPIEEREDCTVRAFWDEGDYLAYQLAYRTSAKPVVWGLPSLSRLFYLQGATFARELRYGLAYTSLQNAVEYEPDHPGPWVARGRLLISEKHYEEALVALQTATTVRSWTPPAVIADCMYDKGIALGSLRRLPEAREAFARTLELDPDHKAAKRNLSRVDYDLWQLRKREGAAPSRSYLM